MTVLWHELRQGRRAALIWSVSCAAFVLLGMSALPKVQDGMKVVEQLIAGMGPLAQAFAMDKLDYGTPLGFYSAEAGNILGLGGGMFACILGLSMLSKEEGRHTAEFLFPHPVSRLWVLVQKYLAMLLQLVLFCLINLAASYAALSLIHQSFDFKVFLRLQLGIFVLLLHLGTLCFGISAFLSRDSLAAGIGLALAMYFINILINLKVGIDWLRYLTPYYYAQPAVLVDAGFKLRYLRLGLGTAFGVMALGFVRYLSKDLRI